MTANLTTKGPGDYVVTREEIAVGPLGRIVLLTYQRSICSACQDGVLRAFGEGVTGLLMSVGVQPDGRLAYTWDVTDLAEDVRSALGRAVAAIPERRAMTGHDAAAHAAWALRIDEDRRSDVRTVIDDAMREIDALRGRVANDPAAGAFVADVDRVMVALARAKTFA